MSGLTDILKEIAPTIATALGGPLAGAAVGFIANKLGVDPSVVEQTVAGMSPTDLVKMKQIDSDFKIAMGQQGISVQLAQIEVNKTEAANINWFVAGARPAVMWICAFAFAYATVIEPMVTFISTVFFHYSGVYPVLNTDITMQALFGLLGLGAYRTYEKSTNTEGNR